MQTFSSLSELKSYFDRKKAECKTYGEVRQLELWYEEERRKLEEELQRKERQETQIHRDLIKKSVKIPIDWNDEDNDKDNGKECDYYGIG